MTRGTEEINYLHLIGLMVIISRVDILNIYKDLHVKAIKFKCYNYTTLFLYDLDFNHSRIP